MAPRSRFASWLLAGVVLIIGVIWLLGETSTIVMPVILACVVGAVATPLVDRLARHRVPRGAGAGLVLLALVAVVVLVPFLVVHGISANASEISAHATQAADKVESAL